MGACLSSTSVDSLHTYAFVVSISGELRHYPTPLFVSEVLQSETQTQNPSFFLSSSDSLYEDHHVPALDWDDELDAGQIYFILPKTMLARRLTAPQMAALAVKASLALDSNSNSNSNSNSQKRKNNKARISPLVLMEASQISVVVEEEDDDVYNNIHKQKQSGLRVSRSRSIRKMSRYSSSTKALRSFRLGLSTIYENEGCDDIIN